MPYLLDTEILIAGDNLFYIISSQHRDNHPNKTRWTVNPEREIKCFKKAQRYSWCIDFNGWGILRNTNKKIIVIGTNRFNESLKIAKFIDSNRNNKWHGYPSDYVRKVQDRPSINILLDWEEKGYISKHHISRIRSGKKCNL